MTLAQTSQLTTDIWIRTPITFEQVVKWSGGLIVALGALYGVWIFVRGKWFAEKKESGLAQIDVDRAIALARIAADAEIAKARREAEKDTAAIARGLVTLIDANTLNPKTPDLDPSTESRIKAIATGTGDGGAGSPPVAHAPTPEQIRDALKDK